MDITASTTPKSDQQNFDDYIGGPKIVTISKVSAGSAEQPVNIELEEFPGRPYKPSKSMRRVLIAAWGPESSVYIGRKMKLVGDPTVKFGGIAVGGIKIAELSHIDKSLKLALTVTRAKREAFEVQPLSTATAEPKVTRTSLEESGANFGQGVGDVMSEKQMGMIGALFGKLGMKDQAMQLAYASDVIERPIADAKQLTMHEASRVITYLKKDEEALDKADNS